MSPEPEVPNEQPQEDQGRTTRPPETDNPHVFIHWMRGIPLEQRFQYTDQVSDMILKRPLSEQQVLLHLMKEIGFNVGTMREHMRHMEKAAGAKVRALTHYTGTDQQGREYLAEMIYRPDQTPSFGFLVYWFDAAPGASPEFFEKLKTPDGVEIRPLATELAASGAVLFPSSYEEYGDDHELFTALGSYIAKYVQVDEDAADTLELATAYTKYTWLQDCVPVAPYFRVQGDYAAGKTTMLRTVGQVCYRPIFAGGTATAAPLFRIMHRLNGTLILDEADFSMKDQEWLQVLKILNQGWAKGSPVLRAERANDYEPFDVRAFDCFGAKVLASRRDFPDVALESRCLARTMVPPIVLRPDIPLFPDHRFYAEAASLRNQLLLWRFRNYKSVQVDPRQRIDGVEPRLTANALVLLSTISDRSVQARLEAMFRRMSDEHRQARHDSYEGHIAQAVVRAWARARRPSDFFNLDLATEEFTNLQKQPVTPKKMGDLVRRVLGLQTRKVGGIARVLSPPAEITALALRYAIDLLEAYQPPPGTVAEPPKRTPVRG